MTAFDVQAYRVRLRELAARLGGEVAVLRDEALRPTGTETGGATDEQADPGSQAADEGVALTLLEAEGHTLAEVNAALDRIDRGTFGRCEGCGKPIPRARLDAVPYARRCVYCARAAETGESG
jgi:RNA polymerase-binding transcription factor DksA